MLLSAVSQPGVGATSSATSVAQGSAPVTHSVSPPSTTGSLMPSVIPGCDPYSDAQSIWCWESWQLGLPSNCQEERKYCSVQQRFSYAELVAALWTHFRQVKIQSLQSSIFHEHKQKSGESIDNYVLDSQKLFHRAYSNMQGSREAEAIGKSVVSNQFVTG